MSCCLIREDLIHFTWCDVLRLAILGADCVDPMLLVGIQHILQAKEYHFDDKRFMVSLILEFGIWTLVFG